jgi:hypothetical protein
MVAGSQQYFDVQIHFQQDSRRTFQSLEQSSLVFHLRPSLLLNCLGLVYNADCYIHLLHGFESAFDSMEIMDGSDFVLLVAKSDLSIHTRWQIMVATIAEGGFWKKESETSC